MLCIRVIAVGGLKEKYWVDAVAEYEKRLRRYCKFEIIEVKEDRDVEKTCRIIEEKVRGFCFLCDIGGDFVSSPDIAHKMQYISHTSSVITFVIGGSHGLGGFARADERISFGKITLPHQLFRVVLCEQIYRAFTINCGESYHK